MIVPALAAVRNKVLERLLVVDDSVLRLDEVEVTDAVREGLDLFNVYAPLELVFQVAGDGTKKRFVLNDDIATWVKSISRVKEVDYVTGVDTDGEFIRRLGKEYWIQSVSTTGDEVLNVQTAPSTGETLRITWNTYSTIKDLDAAAATTISERYTEAFYLYAVHAGAMFVARKAARLKQSGFGGDITSLDELYQRWTDIARRLKKQADERLGSIQGSVTGVGVSGNWKTKSRFGGGQRITHQ